MKVWINKKHFKIFKEMQDESRTDKILISTFRLYNDNREIEVEIMTNPQTESKGE